MTQIAPTHHTSGGAGLLELDPAAFDLATAQVRRAAATMREDRRRICRDVDDLLDGGWSGPAARAFAAGFDDWRAAARDVLEGLEAMEDLLRLTRRDTVLDDETSQAALDRVADRIVERLG